MVIQLSCSLFSSVTTSHKRAPEELGWFVLVVGGEELGASLCEFLHGEQAVAVGVDGLEALHGELRVEPEDFEEFGELLGLDHTVIVGVDGGEVERERSGNGILELGVSYHLLHAAHEGLLGQGVATGNVVQVVIPNLEEKTCKSLHIVVIKSIKRLEVSWILNRL